jgi:glutathione S-transferase
VTIEAPGAAKPLVLAESGAIVEYLVDHFSSARPTLVPQRYTPGSEGKVGGETEEWLRYRYFMHYTEGSLMPFLVMTLVNDCEFLSVPRTRSCLFPSRDSTNTLTAIRNAPPFFVRPITSIVASQVENQFLTRNVEGNLAFLEDQLRTSPEGGDFICGKELTAADILLSFPVIAVTMRVLKDKKNKDKFPLLVAYAKRLEGIEGYKRAVKKIEEIEGKFSASM